METPRERELRVENLELRRRVREDARELLRLERAVEVAEVVADCAATDRDDAREEAKYSEEQLRELLTAIADVERGIRSHDELLALAARIELKGVWNG